jgi:hypothetical protein
MPKRTTVTLDDDVAARLEEEGRQRGESLREVLNDALRRGLSPQRRIPGKAFKIRGPFVRSRPGLSFDNIEELLDHVEGPRRK